MPPAPCSPPPAHDVLFGPEDRIVSHILTGIHTARETIDIAVFLLGAKTVANALAKAHQRGVLVRIILDAKIARTRYSAHKVLLQKGIEVRTIRVKGGSMHAKFVLIDGKKLIAGTANLTNDANYRNHEFAFVWEDPEASASFVARFDDLWKAALPCRIRRHRRPKRPLQQHIPKNRRRGRSPQTHKG
jgi:phosphatidylserine/phosphatidylglycerophosphate/cardiolipin synthase-like enzyme